jgi:CheY-like chemotaxis protein
VTIKCPKCSTSIDATPDELGMVTCGKCGARLRSKSQVKVSVQAPRKDSDSHPSLPKIDPSRAAPADVDSVLARIDAGPSPDETIRPGAFRPLPRPAPAATLDSVLAELRALRRTQDEILSLLRARPASPAGAAAPAGPGARPRAATGARSLLVIDDDAATRQQAAQALQKVASVRTAADGNLGLAAIAEERPAAIVLELDVGAPMPGRDVVNLIKATMEWVDIPIVLHTRLPLGEDQEAAQLNGADAIVPKGPDSARSLTQRVAALLER